MNNNEYKAKIMSNYFDAHDVPYNCAVRSDISIDERAEQVQFTFDWCGGDVIMDTLSVFNCEEDRLVESYMFPWDEDDITRDYPEEMAKRITQYYNEIREGA